MLARLLGRAGWPLAARLGCLLLAALAPAHEAALLPHLPALHQHVTCGDLRVRPAARVAVEALTPALHAHPAAKRDLAICMAAWSAGASALPFP
jgi:hypothetical protein